MPRLMYKKPCRLCGARMMYNIGASHAVWRHPAAEKGDVERVPIGTYLLAPMEFVTEIHQFECESKRCQRTLQVIQLSTAFAHAEASEG